MHKKSKGWIVLSLALLVLSTPRMAFAHRVYLFAYRDGDTVYTESYFGKSKVVGGEIRVYDESGKMLLKGKTDDKGLFSFKMSPDKSIHIELIASMGHKAKFFLKSASKKQSPKEATTTVKADVKTDKEPSPASSYRVDIKEVKRMMEEVLDSRLRSIHDRLTQIQEDKGPGFTEVIGGIGYIVGLMGLVLYFRSKKNTTK
jgi:nickel transport protein